MTNKTDAALVMTMPKIKRRRFRPPVLSRLTFAWAGFACAIGALSIFALTAGAQKEPRIALAVADAPQSLAQPPQTARATTIAENDRPVLRDAARAGMGEGPKVIRPTQTSTLSRQASPDDVFADVATQISPSAIEGAELSSSSFVEDLSAAGSGEVVITIDGAPAKRSRHASRASGAAPRIAKASGPAVANPIASLLNKTVHGNVPKVSASGKRASRAYAKPFDGDKTTPKVSIVVAGLGLNAALTESAIAELPPGVTLAFAPYAKNLDRWTERARAAGHELVLELPMEAHRGQPEALGPAALLTARSADENVERLNWLLARFEGYFAATNYLGGKFSADPEAMRPVLETLKKAGVAYIDDTGAAQRAGVPGEWTGVSRLLSASGDLETVDSVKRDLAVLETIAQRDGAALGKAYLHEQTLAAIIDWSRNIEQRGVTLAPASTILHEAGPVF